MIKEFLSNNVNETMSFAEDFAQTLKPGDIVLLKGDLGAGKTMFVKGVANKLSNGNAIAVSPTFLIVNVYDTSPQIYHFDLYRINDESELFAIGAEEYLFGNGISFVEWPERAMDIFPSSAICVEIIKIDNEKRLIRIDRK